MKKQTIIIGFVISILIITSTFFLVLHFSNKREETNILNLENAAKKYFEETLNNEVYIETLIENGYLSSSKEKCLFLKYNGENIEKENGDCKRAKEEAKKPIIIFSASNNFKFNQWNQTGAKIKALLKNDGNRYYKKEDIKNIIWIDEESGEVLEKDILDLTNENSIKRILLAIEFEDGLVMEKQIEAKIDKEKPLLQEKYFRGKNISAIYTDNEEVNKIYYGITETNEKPNKKNMKEEVIPKLECGKKYYGWSYAIDKAGNETEIDFLGEYEPKCTTITVPSGPVSNSPNYSKPED